VFSASPLQRANWLNRSYAVFVQFGACRCVWCDDAERGGDDALLLSACDSEVVGVVVAD
jgi:hypothetical protein